MSEALNTQSGFPSCWKIALHWFQVFCACHNVIWVCICGVYMCKNWFSPGTKLKSNGLYVANSLISSNGSFPLGNRRKYIFCVYTRNWLEEQDCWRAQLFQVSKCPFVHLSWWCRYQWMATIDLVHTKNVHFHPFTFTQKFVTDWSL